MRRGSADVHSRVQGWAVCVLATMRIRVGDMAGVGISYSRLHHQVDQSALDVDRLPDRLAGEEQLDELAKSSSRSEVIERAVRDYLAARARAARDAHDLEIMNRLADTYNVETADLLTYQPWIDLGE